MSSPGTAIACTQTGVPLIEIPDEGVPRAMIEDTLARLRGLHNDEERFKALEQYGQLKFLLANELGDGDTPLRTAVSRDPLRPTACPDKQVLGHALA